MLSAQVQRYEHRRVFGGLTRILPPAAVLLLALGACGTVASAQDPLKTLPGNYRLVFENAEVAVIRAHYGAHEAVAVHDHPSVATVFVYLNDAGPVRINHADGGTTETVVRPPTVAGSYRVAPGLAERHSIENPGETSSEFLRVEMKGVTLEIKEPFRGKAPAGPLKNEDAVEFRDPAVRVERIVCVDAAPCAVKAEEAESLVVALTAVRMDGKKMEMGDVRWVAAGESIAIVEAGRTNRQLMRIVLPRVDRKQ